MSRRAEWPIPRTVARLMWILGAAGGLALICLAINSARLALREWRAIRSIQYQDLITQPPVAMSEG